jgi:hypothetical protein
MNTLDKIAKIEQSLASLTPKLAVFEKLAMSMPTINQDVGNLRKDLATLTKAIQNITEGVNVRHKNLNEQNNAIITRCMGLESSFASLSKMFAAVVTELSETKVLNQKNVMTNLRKSQEENDRGQVEGMLKLKIIEESPVIESESMVIVSQTFTPKDESKTPEIISEYRVLNFANPELEKDTKQNYLGKAANDVVNLNLDDGVLSTTIVQVYSYVKIYAKGEGEPAVPPGVIDSPATSPASEQT